VSLSGSETPGSREAEPRATTEWLTRMVRSTSALFDVTAARSLLDRPTARAVLSRFGASIPESDSEPNAAEVEQPVDSVEEEPGPPKLGTFEVMNRTIDIAQAALARHTLAAYPPDVLIEVPRSTCRGLEFHRAAEVIDIGHMLAADALDTFETEADQAAPPLADD
jgi:NTE family protein